LIENESWISKQTKLDNGGTGNALFDYAHCNEADSQVTNQKFYLDGCFAPGDQLMADRFKSVLIEYGFPQVQV